MVKILCDLINRFINYFCLSNEAKSNNNVIFVCYVKNVDHCRYETACQRLLLLDIVMFDPLVQV